jgi:hypothetical protein
LADHQRTDEVRDGGVAATLQYSERSIFGSFKAFDGTPALS